MSCRLLDRRSPIFDVEHLQLFTPQSLRRLLSEAGLRDITVRPVYNRYPVAYWTKLFPFPGRIKSGLLWLLKITAIGRIPLVLPAGNLVVWGFRSSL